MPRSRFFLVLWLLHAPIGCWCESALAQASPRVDPPAPAICPSNTVEASGYSLGDLESLAIATNPALAEAASRIEAARGRSWQAGLAPNPTAGYLANEIGNEGSLGQHGAFIGQRFVRGGKLQLDRAIECREVQRLVEEYHVTRQRIMTDVRSAYFSIVWLQQRMCLLDRMLKINQNAASIAERINEAGDNTKSDVLFAQLEYEQTATDRAALDADYSAKWRELARIVGEPYLAADHLSSKQPPVDELSWEDALTLMQQSPRLAATRAELAKNQMALRRAIVEPTPNISTQVSVQYDYGSNDTFVGLQVGMPIPIHNRNQGGIYAANANVRASMQKIDRTRLLIEKQLAVKYGAYENAKKQLDRIEKQIVPKAEEVVKIALSAYRSRAATMADVLNAQRSLLRAALRQQDAARQLRLSYVAIEGFLLSDGLGDRE